VERLEYEFGVSVSFVLVLLFKFLLLSFYISAKPPPSRFPIAD